MKAVVGEEALSSEDLLYLEVRQLAVHCASGVDARQHVHASVGDTFLTAFAVPGEVRVQVRQPGVLGWHTAN
jgi:hypothetical protein